MDEKTMLWANPVEKWLMATVVALVLASGIHFLRKLMVARMGAADSRLALFIRDMLYKTNLLFIVVVALYLASTLLNLSERATFILQKTVIVAAILQLGIWVHGLLTHTLELSGIREQVDSRLAKGAVNTLHAILRVILWSVVLLLILTNLGIKVGPLLAGLGIGGIAIALGVQHTLQDVAASLSILFDKPFMVGDFIIIGDFMGTVEYIGIKTTRLLSLSGEQIIFSNNDLLSSRIRNYKKMVERRILFTFQVPYTTSFDKIKEVPLLIKNIVDSVKRLRFDRAHLKQFATYAFEFEVVYYVLDPAYNTYMDMQQRINFDIIQEFEKRGIAFAFPKQEVILENPNFEPT